VIESICWTNCTSFEEADVIVLGVPDESKSHALRKGTNEAPQHIRRISNIRDSYKRSKKKSEFQTLGIRTSEAKKSPWDCPTTTYQPESMTLVM